MPAGCSGDASDSGPSQRWTYTLVKACPQRLAGSASAMSVYSRWVEARGTISMESTPAPFHPSNPVFFSRRGSGACVGGPGFPWIDEPCCIQ
jgi:hypothetical protein